MLRTSERPWIRWLGRTHLQGVLVGAEGSEPFCCYRGIDLLNACAFDDSCLGIDLMFKSRLNVLIPLTRSFVTRLATSFCISQAKGVRKELPFAALLRNLANVSSKTLIRPSGWPDCISILESLVKPGLSFNLYTPRNQLSYRKRPIRLLECRIPTDVILFSLGYTVSSRIRPRTACLAPKTPTLTANSNQSILSSS